MSLGGGYRGTSVEQDKRFSNKEETMLKMMKYPAEFSQKVKMEKVNLSSIIEWMKKKLEELLGFEDDITCGMFEEYLVNAAKEGNLDPRRMQNLVVPFLNEDAVPFMKELWCLLLDAQQSRDGVPAKLKVSEDKSEEISRKEEIKPALVIKSDNYVVVEDFRNWKSSEKHDSDDDDTQRRRGRSRDREKRRYSSRSSSRSRSRSRSRSDSSRSPDRRRRKYYRSHHRSHHRHHYH